MSGTSVGLVGGCVKGRGERLEFAGGVSEQEQGSWGSVRLPCGARL